MYSYIDGAQRAGVWTRSLRARTNLLQAVLTRCLKTREAKARI